MATIIFMFVLSVAIASCNTETTNVPEKNVASDEVDSFTENARRDYRQDLIRQRYGYIRNTANKEEIKDPFTELLKEELDGKPKNGSSVKVIEKLNPPTDLVDMIPKSSLNTVTSWLMQDSHELKPNEGFVMHFFHILEEQAKQCLQKFATHVWPILKNIIGHNASVLNRRKRDNSVQSSVKPVYGQSAVKPDSQLLNILEGTGIDKVITNYFIKNFKCFLVQYLRRVLDGFDTCRQSDKLFRTNNIPEMFNRMPNISDQVRLSLEAISKSLANDRNRKIKLSSSSNELRTKIEKDLNNIAKTYYDYLITDFMKNNVKH